MSTYWALFDDGSICCAVFFASITLVTWFSPRIHEEAERVWHWRVVLYNTCAGGKKMREDGGRQRERERAILGTRPSMSFSNRMKKSLRRDFAGQSLVDCTLYRKWLRVADWHFTIFFSLFGSRQTTWTSSSLTAQLSTGSLQLFCPPTGLFLLPGLDGTGYAAEDWRLNSLHRHGRQGEQFRAGWCFLLEDGMMFILITIPPTTPSYRQLPWRLSPGV